MCCITIETDVLMANFFGSPECGAMGINGVSLDKIEKCAKVLANNLPGYVLYDLSQKKVSEFLEENNEFVRCEDKICYRGEEIDREQYNNIYSELIAKKISQVVDGFFKYQLYNKDIKILMPVRA